MVGRGVGGLHSTTAEMRCWCCCLSCIVSNFNTRHYCGSAQLHLHWAGLGEAWLGKQRGRGRERGGRQSWSMCFIYVPGEMQSTYCNSEMHIENVQKILAQCERHCRAALNGPLDRNKIKSNNTNSNSKNNSKNKTEYEPGDIDIFCGCT